MARSADRNDPLSLYRAKRSAEASPEPYAAARPDRGYGGLFVVHLHRARRLHYDLRLEMEGVLRSWAVPKGPSKNPKDKRLAVLVEDHPLEYGDFEGIIPEGNYGAGPVIVWDRGEWIPLGDVEDGFKRGKLLFELKGYKLKGRWTLVRIKSKKASSGKEWLLIKERDGYVSLQGDDFPAASVLSGLTVDELAEGGERARAVLQRLRELRAPRRSVRAEDAGLMLATPAEQPFTKEGWIFEIKYDGYRVLAARHSGRAKLLSRNRKDLTAVFPEIARAVQALPYESLVLDGEVVCLDDAGRPSFDRLQQRGRLQRSLDIKNAAVRLPATLFAFDLLAFEGFDLRPLPLVERKRLLREILPPAGALRYADHVEKEGEAFYRELMRLRLEGMVGKRSDSPYRGGRSSDWIKVRAERTGDFVVVGFTAPRGSRSGFGALHLASFVRGELKYAGRVGSGFAPGDLEEIRQRLEVLRRRDPPCSGPVPRGKNHTWIEPELVCEVRYKERTAQGLLRQPVFLRFRNDKDPRQCEADFAPEVERHPEAVTLQTTGPVPDPDTVPVSNADKVFWPEDGYTKGDLIAYYRSVAQWLLPYLEDRPLVLTRYPDGIGGKSFFQKDAPSFVPPWIRTERLWSAGAERELDYLVCDSESALIYIANLGAIPLHVWGSRIGSLELPDWCILDLDPKEAPFTHVVTVAREIKSLCDRIELPCFVKTSGSTGLHVLIPLGRQLTYQRCRQLGMVLARVVASELREIATVARNPARREGRVYIDYVQNGHGRLLVAPFSARPIPGAPVSMPLEWREVNDRLDPASFDIRTAPARMRKLKRDPMREILELKPDLQRSLELLYRLLDRSVEAVEEETTD
ncbi:MAG: ATP-dependent DNA ligase [Gemmatimonadales bacterium]|nr:MAG: ATP-dependent DNA ligase [Gemmatimonadales bacterium]